MMHTSSRTIVHFPAHYSYIDTGAEEWGAENSWWSGGLHLPLSMQNQQTLSPWGKKNTNFFLLKISQKQLLLSYFEWLFWEQLVAAILYMVDGWQEPGCGRGRRKTESQCKLWWLTHGDRGCRKRPRPNNGKKWMGRQNYRGRSVSLFNLSKSSLTLPIR